ncbi:hypothetical protein F5141DRAFT_1209692 [Pisolithus sp. B1]|nr:hypothetical protein F5141DRAFT_1209692 [Pisolithus sp. B1]
MSVSVDLGPLSSSKLETDTRYGTCILIMVPAIADDVWPPSAQLPRLGVSFGTHNLGSSELVLQEVVKERLAREADGRMGHGRPLFLEKSRRDVQLFSSTAWQIHRPAMLLHILQALYLV